MIDPKATAESILGPIEWEDPTAGTCQCPGRSLHTHPTRKRDCLVRIDGAPTVYCFHTSCTAAVDEANSRLRSALGASPWELRLPGGHLLRSGQHAPSSVLRPHPCGGSHRERARFLADVTQQAHDQTENILEQFYWPYADICSDSPVVLDEVSPEAHFNLWLKLWPPDSIVWIGGVSDSGGDHHKGHFRPLADWYQIGPIMGQFTCAASFHPGATSRSNASVQARPFLVVESDILSRDEVGAVFRFLHKRLRHRLHCIIDTGGKSLHAWFSPPDPPTPVALARLRAGLTGLRCDPRLFNLSQPVRLPGAMRGEKLQKLIWLRS